MERPTKPTGAGRAGQGLSDYSSLAFTPPVRPGQSPYLIKGLGYRSFFDDCERTVPGGKAALLAAIAQPELREFFEQDFLVGSWFDLFPLPLARQIAARLARVPLTTHLRNAMQFTAKRDFQTVYRKLFGTATTPQAIMDALDVVGKQYTNFAPLIRTEQYPTSRVAYREGVPTLLFPWLSTSASGYTVSILELAGVRSPSMRVTTSPSGIVNGIETLTMRVETSWEDG